MASVYRHAYITIVATSSHNSRGGCFRRVPADMISRLLRHSPGLMIQGKDLGKNPLKRYPEASYHPLLQRAWMYQERRLSARVVHFTNTQLVWECKSLRQSENGLHYRTVYDFAESGWQSMVHEYSGLRLTFEEDRLPAIAAIVDDEMKVRPNGTYIAGMWRETLLTDLTWHRYPDPKHPRPR